MGMGRARGLELWLFVLEEKKRKKNKKIYITLEINLSVSHSVLALLTWPEVEVLVPRGQLGGERGGERLLCPRGVSLDLAEQAPWWS